jgi:membrane-associated phospholipid phosphatase
MVLVVGLLAVTQTLKKLIKRKRPIYATEDHEEASNFVKKRLANLGKREIGSAAMPSGDSAQGALWVIITMLFFQTYSILLVIPMVCFGRVYFRCHWIGDTLVGTLIGAGFAVIGYFTFSKFADVLIYFFPGFIDFLSPKASHAMY